LQGSAPDCVDSTFSRLARFALLFAAAGEGLVRMYPRLNRDFAA